MSLTIEPALRARLAVTMFASRVGAHDWALLVKKHGREQAEAFGKPYEPWVDAVVAGILAEGGTLPGAALPAPAEVDPLA